MIINKYKSKEDYIFLKVKGMIQSGTPELFFF